MRNFYTNPIQNPIIKLSPNRAKEGDKFPVTVELYDGPDPISLPEGSTITLRFCLEGIQEFSKTLDEESEQVIIICDFSNMAGRCKVEVNIKIDGTLEFTLPSSNNGYIPFFIAKRLTETEQS